jgi:hypothetical protein
MNSYEEELGFIAEADDTLFPNWLFNPVFNEFDDNYYQHSFVEDELTRTVKKLRRRYNDFFDWSEAMTIYNEYMEKLVDKYGSMRVIRNSLKINMMDDPVPSRPKLKNNRKNRQFLRSGVIPSRRVVDVPVSNEDMIAIARQAYPDMMGDEVSERDNFKKLPKAERERLKKIQASFAGRNRRQNLYRTVGESSGTDFIVEYLNQARKGVYDSSGYHEEKHRSLVEEIEEEEKRKLLPIEFQDDDFELENLTTIQNGRIVNRAAARRMEIYKELYDEGFDIIGGMGKSMDKKAVKMIRAEIGATEPASKKELKKIKKRNKKDRARIQRRQDEDALLERTLLGNKLNVSRDRDGNLSLRLRDLYPD